MTRAIPSSGQGATLITGASGGIGAAIGNRILARGGRVVNVSDRPPEAASGVIAHIADLTDADQTRDVLAKILHDYPIDRFVHCAGVPHMAPIEEFDLNAFRKVTDLHLRAAMQCIGMIVPQMKERRHGHIVLIGSRVSLGRVHSSLYGSVKSAIIGMAKGLAVELAPFGININVVSPGPVDTPLLRIYHPVGSPRAKELEASIPMGRIASADDVVNAVEFFLKDESSYITGQNLFLCGGLDIASAPRA